MLLFLSVNGYRLNHDLPQNDLLNFIIEVASGQKTLEECQDWIKNHIETL
jgi:prophage maintenance system killer protein